MTSCIVFSAIIALFSIFAFFGNAFSNVGDAAIPNMFHLMFGLSSTYKGSTIHWERYDVLTFLFVLQILIIIAAIVSFFVCYNIKANYGEELYGVLISVIMSLLSFVALIVSFCTILITDINKGGYHNYQLGFGPILYSVLHIVIVIVLVIGIFLNHIQPSYTARSKLRVSRPPASTAYPGSLKGPSNSAKPTLSEDEKIELILKYKKMMDDGVITQDEFAKKKKELL
ncbi:MAG: SHOCT domain-containing protein [Clostridia bacterium]|nr:SHOCT domain-containing protein [Clostridia bacterium]